MVYGTLRHRQNHWRIEEEVGKINLLLQMLRVTLGPTFKRLINWVFWSPEEIWQGSFRDYLQKFASLVYVSINRETCFRSVCLFAISPRYSTTKITFIRQHKIRQLLEKHYTSHSSDLHQQTLQRKT